MSLAFGSADFNLAEDVSQEPQIGMSLRPLLAGLQGIVPVLPVGRAGPLQAVRGPRPRALAPMHPAAAVRHGRALAGAAVPPLGAAPRRGIGEVEKRSPPGCMGFIAHFLISP